MASSYKNNHSSSTANEDFHEFLHRNCENTERLQKMKINSIHMGYMI